MNIEDSNVLATAARASLISALNFSVTSSLPSLHSGAKLQMIKYIIDLLFDLIDAL
ncbi:MAG: hypothetical protein IPK03_04260 [Bacteroidetes bacterium]|nr:hypothetical protein [Bacteroidota bacterium]